MYMKRTLDFHRASQRELRGIEVLSTNVLLEREMLDDYLILLEKRSSE